MYNISDIIPWLHVVWSHFTLLMALLQHSVTSGSQKSHHRTAGMQRSDTLFKLKDLVLKLTARH